MKIPSFFYLAIIILSICCCKKDPPKSIPTLNTTAATNITATTATAGGNITSDGNSPITARGVCWSTNQSPTISDSKTIDGKGIGTFLSSVTELLPGSTTYARAYATNDVGTAYGTQIVILTTSVLPILTTTDLIEITSTTATGGGNITSDGGAAVIARGVCWSRNPMPIIRADSTTNNGTGLGVFSSPITGLSPGKNYFIRAYATNSVGSSYGNQITFNTSAVVPTVTTSAITDITPETANGGGIVTIDGGSEVTARGVCWSTGQTPTIEDSKTAEDLNITSFNSNLTGLIDNTTYYVRAYATNSIGTGYGNSISFTTTVYSTQSDYKPTGMLVSTQEEIESIPTIESSGILTSLMVKSLNTVNNKHELEVPPSYNQFYYQNCVGAAVGYGMMSVLYKQVEGYDNYDGDYTKFSPFYIWNQLNIGGINTSLFCTIGGALKLVKEQGCCKLSDMPLTTLPSTSPSLIARANASTFKLSVYRFESFNISTYKTLLSEGYPIVIGVFVDNAFMNQGEKQFEKQSDGRLVWSRYYDISRKGHAMLICGYDDEINAFKVLNSWGEDWGNDGCFWIDYSFLKEALNNKIFDPHNFRKEEAYIGVVKRPIISTKTVTDITNSEAKSGGIITKDWNNIITSKGVCWSFSPNPAIFNNKTLEGAGKESFNSVITGLKTGTKYYLKAYAINSEGISYGKQQSFTTSSIQSPTVITSQITSFTSISAIVGGNVTSNGGTTITERGIYYSTNILLNGIKLHIGSGSGVFTTNLTGLTPNTTYYIKAYAINSQGTAFGSQVNFTTGVIPAAAFTATPTTISAGESVQFTDQSTNTPTSWYWNFGDGGTSTTRNPSHMYIAQGSYTVTLTASNNLGSNMHSKTNYITVNLLDNPPKPAFTANPTTVRLGESIQFTDQSSNTPTSWFWNFGDGGTSTIQNPIYTYSNTGTYTVILTATNRFGYDSERKTNYINVYTSGNTVTDIDGNTYNTVTIGTQIWMRENLKTTRYRNGDVIGSTSPATLDITTQSSPKYQWACNGNESNVATYGRLYTWYAATDSRNICPTGWHLPSDAEWTVLTSFLGGESVAGGKLKEAGTSHWASPNTGTTNSSSFTALPGGYRYYGGAFDSIGSFGYWWSSTGGSTSDAWGRSMNYGGSNAFRGFFNPPHGFSVRCIKDN